MFEIINNVLKGFSEEEIKDGVLTIPEGISEILFLPNFKDSVDLSKVKKVVCPSSLKVIHFDSFYRFSNLTEIELNEGLEKIEKNAFMLTDLKDIVIPNSVKVIGQSVFDYCENLKSVVFPTKLKNIPTMFMGCKRLSSVVLPKNLENIESALFLGTAISNIDLPNSIKYIGARAFDSTNISKITIPETVEIIEASAFNNTGIKTLKFDKKNYNNKFFLIEDNDFCDSNVVEDDKNYYLYYNSKRLRFKSNKYSEVKKVDFKVSSNFTSSYYIFGNASQMDFLIDNINSDYLSPNLLFALQRDIINGEEIDLTYFNNLTKLDIPYNIKDKVITLAYNMGIFKKPVIETRISKSGNEIKETVNYAHKAYEFFRQLDFSMARGYFSGINSFKFKPDFVKFLTDKNNTKGILEQEAISAGFIGKIYNKFEEVQETNKSHKGSQRQLSPTIEKFINFFSENKFKNVGEGEKEFASFIGKFYDDQEVFEAGKKVLEWQKQNNIKSNITSQSIIEEKIDRIEKLKQSIINNASNITKSLNEIAQTKFSYEFLDKHSWLNLVLGKYCDCCAHISGYGGGIAVASMVNSDVQNIVIKNTAGKIVSKATLYVNRQQGYGVINTIEVKQTLNDEDKEIILKKYLNAINKFVEKYNLENTKKITQINIGANNNDLINQLKANNFKESPVNLEAIDFSKYAVLRNYYEGDWQDEQLVIYKDEKEI